MKPFYTLDQVIRDLATIRALAFAVFPGFWSLTPEQIQTQSNGSGPGSWSNDARRALTSWETEGARLAAIVHDIDYCCPDKSAGLFHRANRDFRDNQCRWARHAHPVDVVARGLCEAEAEAQFAAVELGGWDSWLAGDTLSELEPDPGPERIA